MKKIIYQFIFTKIFGWKIDGTFDTSIKKCVFIVVSHTSWTDFFIGVATRGILNIEINFVGKKELFVFPLSYYFKWMGGEPLNRPKNENKVDTIAKIFNQKEIFRLSLSPEGTRKKVTHWKTGYYYIAHKAQVPIIAVGFDYTTKNVKIFQPFYTTGNYEADYKKLQANFIGIMGKFSKKSFTPQNDIL